MARRYSTLGDIIDQLKENNNTQLDTTNAVDSLTNVLSKQFVKQNKDMLENKREAKPDRIKTTTQKSSGGAGGGGINFDMSGIKGVGILGGLGLLAGGIGTLIKGLGIGLGGAAVGFGAFITMLAKADKELPNGGENVKKLLTNLAKGLNEFSDRDAKGFAGLLATGAIFGALRGPIGGLSVGIGIAAVGAGIGGFMAGLGLADMSLDAMSASGERLKTFMTNIAKGLEAFSSQGMMAFGAAMGAGGAMGLLFGIGKKPFLGKVGRAVGTLFGLPAIGAGIAGFMTTLSLGDKALGFFGSDGSKLKVFMTNIADGLKAFGTKELVAAGALLLGSALLGATTGGIGAVTGAVGIAAIGTAISLFLLELAAVDKISSWVNADGSGLKKLSVGIADSLIELSRIPEGMKEKIDAVGNLGIALVKLLGGFGLAKITTGVVDTFKKISNALLGTSFKSSNASNKTFLAEVVDSITPLKDLDLTAVSNLDKLSAALSRFGKTINDIGKTNLEDFKDNVERMIGSMALQLDLIRAMSKGGKIGSFFGLGGVDFGKGFLDPDLKIDELQKMMNRTQDILNKTNINYTPPPAISGTSSVGSKGTNVVTDASFKDYSSKNTYNNTVGQTYVATGPTIDLKDQFGFT